jgi:protein involved in ribonucleotide reduction
VQVFEEIGGVERPAEVFGTMRFTEEFAVVQRFSDPNYIACWSTYGRRLQRTMCEHLATRLRYLQELSFECRPVNARGEKAFESIFGRLTDLIAQKPCGWVHGLKRDHKPRGADWLADAKSSYEALRTQWEKIKRQDPSCYNPDQELDALRALTFGEGTDEAILDQLDLIMSHKLLRSDDIRLCGALIDREELLKSSPSYKQLRKNIRKLKAANEEELMSVEQDYVHLAQHFRGQRVRIVGGDPRQHVLQRVRSYLPESDVEWIELSEHGGVRKIENLCQSIARGGLDVLLIIQDFISHKVTIKLKDQVLLHKSCESEMVTSGYGVTRMLLALEQIHGRLDAPPPRDERPQGGELERT